MNKFLFLDDIRNPEDAVKYTNLAIYVFQVWDVVRSYDEFVKYISTNGLPCCISFDNDLADEHYTPEEYWNDYEKSKQYQESKMYTEKTGYECAKWLVDYCIENNFRLPEYLCHSLNPVGKDNILNYLNNFKKAQ